MPDEKLCPKCKTPLAELTNREVAFLGCESCFGLWVGEGELAVYVERASTPESASSFALLLDKALKGKLGGGKQALRHCPYCSEPLARIGFGESPFIILDRCAEHGLWLDRSELKKVVRACRSAAHPSGLPAGVGGDDDDDDDDMPGGGANPPAAPKGDTAHKPRPPGAGPGGGTGPRSRP